MKVKGSGKTFNTPITIGGIGMDNLNEGESVDQEIDNYLGARKKRLLGVAQMAELEHVTEDEKTNAARARRERQWVEQGKISPIGEEGNMENIEKTVEEAAAVAAEAVSAGVSPEEATGLGTGKSRVVVIKPEATGEADKGRGGWSVIDGKPVKDPDDGEYTFSQALKVASLEKAKGESDPMAIFTWFKKEGMLEGGKGDEFMQTFTAELARKSVDNIVKPPTNESPGVEVLRSEMKELREELRKATDPIEAANRVKTMYDSFKSVGLISEPTGGTSLEELKETHRHEERMEEVQTDRVYKEKLGDVISDLPERVGRGMAGQLVEEEGSGGGGLEHIICECGQEIPITPETGKQVTCPKCDTIFTKKKKT